MIRPTVFTNSILGLFVSLGCAPQLYCLATFEHFWLNLEDKLVYFRSHSTEQDSNIPCVVCRDILYSIFYLSGIEVPITVPLLVSCWLLGFVINLSVRDSATIIFPFGVLLTRSSQVKSRWPSQIGQRWHLQRRNWRNAELKQIRWDLLKFHVISIMEHKQVSHPSSPHHESHLFFTGHLTTFHISSLQHGLLKTFPSVSEDTTGIAPS
jgi:hypothetical protein